MCLGALSFGDQFMHQRYDEIYEIWNDISPSTSCSSGACWFPDCLAIEVWVWWNYSPKYLFSDSFHDSNIEITVYHDFFDFIRYYILSLCHCMFYTHISYLSSYENFVKRIYWNDNYFEVNLFFKNYYSLTEHTEFYTHPVFIIFPPPTWDL